MRKARPAMTLVEMVVAIAIFSVVTTMIYSVFLASARAFDRSNAQVELQMSYQLCLDRISEIIKGASGYSQESNLSDPGASENSHVFTVGTDEYWIYRSTADNEIRVYKMDTAAAPAGTKPDTTQAPLYSCENVETFSLAASADNGEVFDIFIEGTLKGARRDVATSVWMRAEAAPTSSPSPPTGT